MTIDAKLVLTVVSQLEKIQGVSRNEELMGAHTKIDVGGSRTEICT